MANAKDSPWFKFKVNYWNTGDIHLQSYHLKGVFIDLCSYYWSKECDVKVSTCEKKFGKSNLCKLIAEEIVKKDGDTLIINFLNEQWSERQNKSGKASESASSRWVKKGGKNEFESNANALRTQSVGNANKNEKENEKENESYIANVFALTNFIRVGTETIVHAPSEYFKSANQITFEQWKMKNPSDASYVEKVFKKMDDEYNGYEFSDDNHVKRTFFSLLEKVKGSPAKNQSLPVTTTLPGSFFKNQNP